MTSCCSSSPLKRRGISLIITVATFTILIDQISKQLILKTFRPGEILSVIPGLFNLTLTFNPGAAFGLWSNLPSGWREVALGVSILLALVAVVVFLLHPNCQTPLARVSLSAVLGGAIGNIIDRFTYGSVVDFLDFYIGDYHWPAFNIADSAIFLGIMVVVFLPHKPATPESVSTEEKELPL
ncbi:MAG: Lipoprotein signal peptidase [Pseudomonadota bacterium]|jgi:signal peptidase II